MSEPIHASGYESGHELAAALAPIRVVLVEDHPTVRRGLKMILRSADDIMVVGKAGDGEEAQRVCAEVQPDLVLMDLRLPGLGGVETIRALQHFRHVPQVLVLTTFNDERLIAEALAAGASGYLLKQVDKAALTAAIRTAAGRILDGLAGW